MSESDDNIIELYRKALNAKNNNKKDLIKEVSNSVELLKNDIVIEQKDSNDPLENFLFKLTDILKENNIFTWLINDLNIFLCKILTY